MQYILFGAGHCGMEALNFFGKDRVLCFADNSEERAGSEIEGIRVCFFDEIGKTDEGQCVVLTVYFELLDMLEQIKESGMQYLIFNAIENRECYPSDSPEKERDWLNCQISATRHYERQLYREAYLQEKKNAEYLYQNINVRTLKRATGYLRKQQLGLVKFATEFFEEIKELNIHPILGAGNLLGYVRNDGFLPWDDDIDLKLIREEYDKLLEYCSKRFPTIRHSGPNLFRYDNDIYGFFRFVEQHPNEYILEIDPKEFHIIRGTSGIDCKLMDFFSIDAYEENYSFEEHWQKVQRFKEQLLNLDTTEEQFELIEQEKEKDKRHWKTGGKHLYYGFDNIEAWSYFNECDHFLNAEDVFPLQTIAYEGGIFYAPHHPERCMEYVYGKSFQKLPQDMSKALDAHGAYRRYAQRKYYQTVEICVEHTRQVRQWLEFYEKARKDRVYAYFVALVPYHTGNHVSERWEKLQETLEETEVEFHDIIQQTADYALFPQKCEENRYHYSEKTYVLEYSESTKLEEVWWHLNRNE